MRTSLVIPLAIVAGGAILAVAAFGYGRSHRPAPSGTENASLVDPVTPADHIFGNPAAPVIIVEYSDFSCAFCKGFQSTLRQLVTDENGKVAWVYREFPLYEVHPNALSQAKAAECAASAGGNDAFWRFADELFANQPADPSTFGTLAAKAGVPGDAFASCMASASSTISARIDANRKNALSMGAQGTPFSVLLTSGEPPQIIDGAYPYAPLKQVVDTALANARTAGATP